MAFQRDAFQPDGFQRGPSDEKGAFQSDAFQGDAFQIGTYVNLGPVPPTITSQPADVTITEGSSTVLSVTASGSAPLTYQWYEGLSGDTSTPIGGATSSTYTASPIVTQPYWVQVTNAHGTADSNTATVTVIPVPFTGTKGGLPPKKRKPHREQVQQAVEAAWQTLYGVPAAAGIAPPAQAVVAERIHEQPAVRALLDAGAMSEQIDQILWQMMVGYERARLEREHREMMAREDEEIALLITLL